MDGTTKSGRELEIDSGKMKATGYKREFALDSGMLVGWAIGFSLSFDLEESTERPTHLHCPSCEEEIPYDSQREGRVCTACEAGELLIPTVGSIKETRQRGFTGRLVVWLMTVVLLFQGALFAIIYRIRHLKRRAIHSLHRTLVCSCPFCRRKLEYPASSVGNGYSCSVCKTAFRLPDAV